MIRAESLKSLQEGVTAVVSAALPDCTVHSGFAPVQFYRALSGTQAAVTIGRLSAASEGFSDFFGTAAGDASQSDCYGKRYACTLRITLCLPAGCDPGQGTAMVSAVCHALLFQERFAFREILCPAMSFDERLQAFVLQIEAVTDIILAAEEQFTAFTGFEIIGKGGIR